LQGMLLSVSHAVLPDEGEDSFVLRENPALSWMGVADGCGGLGSRRYAGVENHTEAYLAARLVTQAFAAWAQERRALPSSPEDGRRLCRELESDISQVLKAFSAKQDHAEVTRIVGSMQRRLPSTLCAVLSTTVVTAWQEICFLWAGDSRGYVLDANGLHQCTQDHLRGEPDAFEALYRDAPLSNLFSVDQPAKLSMRRLRAPLPCVVVLATDGVFGSLMTPMEMEKLLLDTLLSAKSMRSWERKLGNQIRKLAQDDATLLLQPCGIADLDDLKRRLAPRREILQKQYITPVRRRKRDVAFARERWQAYRQEYDWTQGGSHERMDWRI